MTWNVMKEDYFEILRMASKVDCRWSTILRIPACTNTTFFPLFCPLFGYGEAEEKMVKFLDFYGFCSSFTA